MCDHVFKSEVVVTQIGPNEFKVDIQVACSICFKPLEFVGLQMGVHPELPTKSLDGTECHLNAKWL